MKSISSGDGVFWIEPPLLPRGSRCLFWRLFILSRCLLKLRPRRGVTRGLPSPREGRRPRCGDRASGSRGRWCSLLTPGPAVSHSERQAAVGPGGGGRLRRRAWASAWRAALRSGHRPARGRPLDGDGGRGPQSRGLDARSSRGTEPWAPRRGCHSHSLSWGTTSVNPGARPCPRPVSAPRVRPRSLGVVRSAFRLRFSSSRLFHSIGVRHGHYREPGRRVRTPSLFGRGRDLAKCRSISVSGHQRLLGREAPPGPVGWSGRQPGAVDQASGASWAAKHNFP